MRQVYNNGPGAISEKHISVNARGITLLKRLRVFVKVTKDAGVYINDDGFLCLKFYEPDEAPDGCFKVQWQGKEQTTPVISISTKFLDRIGVKVGHYYAEEKDGFIVTDCKVCPKENS